MKLEVLTIPASEVNSAMVKQLVDARNEDPDNELAYGSQLLSIDYGYGHLVALIDSDADILLGSTMVYTDIRPEWLSADLPMIERINVRKVLGYNIPVIDYILSDIVNKLRESGYNKLYAETDESQALYLVGLGFNVDNFAIVRADL